MNQQLTLDTETVRVEIPDLASENQLDVIETVLEVQTAAATTKNAAEVEQIAARLRREVRRERIRSIAYAGTAGLLYLPLFFTVHQMHQLENRGTVTLAQHIAYDYRVCFFFLLPMLVMLLIPLTTIYARWRIRNSAKRLALGFEGKHGRGKRKQTGKIEALDDVASIGSQIEMLDIDSIPVRNMAIAKLTQLLPQLKASDNDLLNIVQRKRLNRFVGAHRFGIGHRDIREFWSRQARQRDLAFQMAILKAYEQIGDADCLPAVQSLAHPPPHYAKLVPPEIVDAAQQCLLFLEPMIAQDRASKQLLRPSSATEVRPDILLRASMPKTNIEEAVSLLRAGAAVDAFVAPKQGKLSDE